MGRAPLHWLLHRLSVWPADTQTTPAERARLAAHAAGRRRLVEIGVMHGATTRLLCEAMAPDAVLTAIDPFPRGRFGCSFEYAIARREVSRAPARRVIWMRELSHHAVNRWTEAIDFLFIDGDHSWAGIDRDWTAWSPFVANGGVVLLHDSRVMTDRVPLDSVKYTHDVILRDSRFTEIDAVDSLTVMRRRH
jgi:predicted O-methyltransferase YrrM